MKIAICTNHYAPSVGGCELVTRKIAESLHDHDIYVVTRRIPGRKKTDSDSPKVVEYNPQDPQGFFTKINNINPDLVFIYSDVFDFFRPCVKALAKPRLIVALCGANYLYNNRSYALLFHRRSANVEKIVCHSTFDRDYKFCESSFKDKIVVIPNGVDLPEFDDNQTTRDEISKKLNLDTGKKWLLNVSNFFPGKGQEHMVDVVGSFKYLGNFDYIQVSNDIEFAVGKQLENAWQKKVNTRHLSNVQLLKNLPREDVISLFKHSNVFATTSEKEVAPLVILESMAARTPWVSFNVGNVRGLQGGRFVTCRKDRRYHCVISERETRLFYQHVSEVMNLPSLGDVGRKQIDREMTWDVVLPQYRELFEK